MTEEEPKTTPPKQKRKRSTKEKKAKDDPGPAEPEVPKEPPRITLADFLKSSSMSSGRPMKAALEKEARKKKKEDSTAASSTHVPIPEVPAQVLQSPFCTPQVRVIGGQIVIDEQSVILDAPTAESSSFSINNATEHPHITSASYSNRSASEKWTSAETDEFYDAIRRYGTDFTLLEKLFAKRTRKQLKSKFKREEKENPRRIDDALKNTIPIDINHYHTAISQAAEKKKLLEEQKEQANVQTQVTTPKDSNSWETPVFGTTAPQKSSHIDISAKQSAKGLQVQTDEFEIDEETLASLQDAQLYSSYMDNYEEVDDV